MRRRVAEAAYAFLATVCLDTLDRLSISDPKHGARLKLENLAFLEEWLQSTVKLSSSAAQAAASVVLQALQAHVASGKEASANVYIKQQLDHAKLLQLDAFAQVHMPHHAGHPHVLASCMRIHCLMGCIGR